MCCAQSLYRLACDIRPGSSPVQVTTRRPYLKWIPYPGLLKLCASLDPCVAETRLPVMPISTISSLHGPQLLHPHCRSVTPAFLRLFPLPSSYIRTIESSDPRSFADLLFSGYPVRLSGTWGSRASRLSSKQQKITRKGTKARLEAALALWEDCWAFSVA